MFNLEIDSVQSILDMTKKSTVKFNEFLKFFKELEQYRKQYRKRLEQLKQSRKQWEQLEQEQLKQLVQSSEQLEQLKQLLQLKQWGQLEQEQLEQLVQSREQSMEQLEQSGKLLKELNESMDLYLVQEISISDSDSSEYFLSRISNFFEVIAPLTWQKCSFYFHDLIEDHWENLIPSYQKRGCKWIANFITSGRLILFLWHFALSSLRTAMTIRRSNL